MTRSCVRLDIIGSADETLVGTVIDSRYRVLGHFGRGGMGAVYSAEHLGLGRQVALKVLRQERTDPQFRLRFEREIRATASINHPNVVSVFDTGVLLDGSLYFTMELLEGESLDALLRRERQIPWPRLRELALQLCRGLDAAHNRGIIHRDLKPSNIMVIARPGEPEQIKIIDFGIAKMLRDETTEQLTKTGSVLGTLAYMAPEQLRGAGDHRIDVYATGVILYQCLAGRRPFVGTEVELFAAILGAEPPALSERVADLPRAVAASVSWAMARSPDERPATMRALADALLYWDSEDSEARTEFYQRPQVVPAPIRGTVPLEIRGRISLPPNARVVAEPTSPANAPTEPSPRSRLVPAVALGGLLALATAWTLWMVLDGAEGAEGAGGAEGAEGAEGPEPPNGRDIVRPQVTSPEGDVGPSATPTVDSAGDPAESTTSGPAGASNDTAPPSEAPLPTIDGALVIDEDALAVETAAPPPEPRPSPEPRRKRTLQEALQLAAKRAGDKCRSDLNTRIKVDLTVEASGSLRSRRILPPNEGTTIAECILGVLDAQRFPADPSGPTTTTLVVVPRPR